MCSIAQTHCATWTRNRKVERGYVRRNEAQLKAVFANGTLRCRVRDVDQSSPRFILNWRTRPTSCDRRLTFSWSTPIGKLKRFSQSIVFPYEMSKSYNRHKSDTFHDKPRSGTVYLTESVYSPVIPGLVTRHNSTILIIYVRLLRTIKSKWYYKGRYA